MAGAERATVDLPWQGDAGGLVDVDRHPVDELRAVFAAIDRSDPNACSHTQREQTEGAVHDAQVARVS